MFPDRYAGSIFIAEHGSWNRRDPIGYRITEVTIQNGTATSYQPFIEGWLRDGKVYGRPVDVEILPDGSMLISDDMNGVIYLVRYTG
jgi:glucose/arabinose dehydrogenase